MYKNGWNFPSKPEGYIHLEGSSNQNELAFDGAKAPNSLVREICQNSLDAWNNEIQRPVKLNFELKWVKTSEHEVFQQYSKRISDCRKYWGDDADENLKDFLNQAEEELKKGSLPVLVASDFNTKGLEGISDPDKKNSPWMSLIYSDGVSSKDSKNAGGSYGIGKNAPFACSSLRMVFYGTMVANQDTAFIGKAILADSIDPSDPNKGLMATGWYRKNDKDNKSFVPFSGNDRDSFKALFQRKERGTDVIIVGFRYDQDWIPAFKKAVLENFFVAIVEHRLEVTLTEGNSTIRIDADHIDELFEECLNFEKSKYDKEKNKTREKALSDFKDVYSLYCAYSNPDKQDSLTINKELGAVDVYFKKETNGESRALIADVRMPGMLIKYGCNTRRVACAVVKVIRGEKLGGILRAAEPAEHNCWKAELRKNNKDRMESIRKSLRNLNDAVRKFIKEAMGTDSVLSVEAAGIADSLPDFYENEKNASKTQDPFKQKISLSGLRRADEKKASIKKEAEENAESMTTEISIEPTHNPDPPRPGPIPPFPPKPHVEPSIPDDEGNDGGYLIKEIDGAEFRELPRVFCLDDKQGIYQVVMVFNDDYRNVYLSFYAEGEKPERSEKDGSEAKLKLEGYISEGKKNRINRDELGPMTFYANEKMVLKPVFVRKENMMVRLKIFTKVKKNVKG